MKRLLLVLCLLLCVATATAQEDRGRISGLITDPTGAVIPHANVTLTNEATKVNVSTIANEEGLYAFPLLVPGLYTVDVKADGFKEYIVNSLRVEVAGNVKADAKLNLGQSAETVTVTAAATTALRTDDANLGYTIEARSFNDLPELFGNSFTLQLLSPGVTSTSLTADYNHTYEGGSESASVNGAQSGRTEFTLDGAPDTRNGGAVTTAYVPSRDFINEFRLITSPYDASASHTSGGSVDGTLKSGGSQFHGGISGSYQHPSLDATQFSQSTAVVPAYFYHRQSANLGGPILQKKLFFFAGYEHQFNRDPASTTTQTVPTANEKKGDFSELLALGKTTTSTYTCPSTGTKYTTPSYNTYQIFNPYSTRVDPNCPSLYVRDPIPGNVITNVQAMDAVAKKIVNYYPDPNTASTTTLSNFVSSAANRDYYWSMVGRLDYTLSEKQKLFGHYLASRRIQPGKELYFPGASGRTNLLKNKAAVIDYVNNLTNSSLINVRYSATRFYTSTTMDARTTATQLGINANATAGVPDVASGFPYVNITGYALLGKGDPSFEADTIHDAQMSYSKIYGRHQLKFGAEWRLYQANQADYTNEKLYIQAKGTYMTGPSSTLSASAIGQGLAGIEMGIAESTKETLAARTSNNTTYWAGYAQDDWKVTPELTLNLGVRYEYYGPIVERNGKSITYFDTSVASPIAATAVSNYAARSNAVEQSLVPVSAFSVKGGLNFATPHEGLWNSQHLNFSPRFGFSWNPAPKLVARGGFGIFYQHIGQIAAYGSALGYSQTTNTTATNNNGVTFVATLQNPFPNGLSQPTGNTQGLYQNIGTSIGALYVKDPKTPYSERFSFGLQYALPSDLILEADYVGSMGRHLKVTRYVNAIPNSVLSTDKTRTQAMNDLNTKLSASYPNPFNGITVPVSQSLFTSSSISGNQLVMPYPEFGTISGSDWAGMSNYNALQTTLSKRFSHGYNMSVGYTWSRSLDALSYLNNGDAKPWYGVSNSDYPQVLTTSAIYELPFGKGKFFLSNGNTPRWLNQVVSGFQVQGTYRIQSGQPLSFNSAGSVLKSGKTPADINAASAHNSTQWFNTHAFENVQDTATYANTLALVSNVRTFPLRFNNVRQDYQNMLNLGATKRFKAFQDRMSAEFRCEAVNALNHQVYAAPNTDPSSSIFGQISGPGNFARRLQFNATFSF